MPALRDRKLVEVSPGGNRISEPDIRASLVNPDISHALTELSALILRKAWIVTGSSSLIAQFVARALKPVWTKLVLACLEALAWGHSPMEVTWVVRDVMISGKEIVSAVVPVDFKVLPPGKVRYLADEEGGEVVGFRFNPGLGKGKIDYLDEKAMYYAHQEFASGSPYGFPLVSLSKPYEEMLKDMLELMAVWMENMALPPIVGRAPLRMVQLEGGKTIEAAKLVQEEIERLKSSGVAVIPHEYDSGGQPLWGIEVPFTGGEGAQITNVISVLRDLLRSSILGPTGSNMSPGGMMGGGGPGTGSADLMASYVFMEMLLAINTRLLRWLVYLNWGDEEWAVVMSPEAGETDINLVRDLVRTSIQFYPDAREMLFRTVDWQALFQLLGIPLSAEGKDKEDPLGLAKLLEEMPKQPGPTAGMSSPPVSTQVPQLLIEPAGGGPSEAVPPTPPTSSAEPETQVKGEKQNQEGETE